MLGGLGGRELSRFGCKADSGKTGDGGKPRDRADAECVFGARMDESTLN